jgi:hypothetical protein
MPRRLLNIASIVCLVACVALMGMWVRSNYAHDVLIGHFGGKRAVMIYSIPGRLIWYQDGPRTKDNSMSDNYRWSIKSYAMDEIPSHGLPSQELLNDVGLATSRLAPLLVLWTPFWFLALTSGSLAMVLRLRWPWRFTLRSLFIATTFLAVVLGMIAWMDRAWIGK